MKKISDTKNMGAGGRCHQYWNVQAPHRKNTKLVKEPIDYMNLDMQKILQEYNVAGFEFGNWLSIQDRYDFVIATEASLRDLSKIVGVKNLGFNCQLGIAFGARGMSKAKAHFEPHANMINLTKLNGANSLAHEWAHAFDFIVGGQIDQHKHYSPLTGRDGSEASTAPDNIGGQFRALANQIVDAMCKTKNANSWIGYWHRRLEIFARGFEQYVSYTLYQQKTNNIFLAKTYNTYCTNSVYVPEVEFKAIAPLYAKLMKEFAAYANNKTKVISTPYPVMKVVADKKVVKATPITKKRNKTVSLPLRGKQTARQGKLDL